MSVKIETGQLREYLDFAVRLAKQAGLMMQQGSANNKKLVEQKTSFVDLVTETDRAIEQFVFSELRKQYPSHRLVGEESTSSKIDFVDDPTWIIDPIDGTMNFYHQLPFCCISIGLTINREVVLGVVYSPFLNKLYTAAKGQGAYMNGQPIHTKPTKELNQALLIAELGSDCASEKFAARFKNTSALADKCHGIRQLGSAALNICHVAEGCCDAYFEFGIHAWDMAGGAAVLEEAGGVVVDTTGGEFKLMNRRLIAAATPELAKAISGYLVAQLEYESD